MRKFKHKITGILVTQRNGLYHGDTILCLSPNIVENSNDWEEIIEEYPLLITDLKTNMFYTTEYKNQGKYTFKCGCNLYYVHKHNKLENADGNFTNLNGFFNFRKATNEEIVKLIPEYIKIRREFNGYKGWWKIGHIYKTEVSKKSGLNIFIKVDHLELGGNGTCIDNIFYAPSTKEEYDAQFVKKDYEILSLKGLHNSNSGLFKLHENGKYFYESWNPDEIIGFNFEDFHINSSVKIHSVKRLSDGEIFTIGDFVNLNYSEISISDICKFEIFNNNMCIQYSSSQPIQILRPINIIKKVKQPLFKTEDGIDIFERDEVHWVDAEDNKYLYKLRFCIEHKILDFENTYKLFSKKENALEYIKNYEKSKLMTKQCLSLQDILNQYVDKNSYIPQYVFNKLVELVKSKV